MGYTPVVPSHQNVRNAMLLTAGLLLGDTRLPCRRSPALFLETLQTGKAGWDHACVRQERPASSLANEGTGQKGASAP